MRASSSDVTCVAWISDQRASTANRSNSHSTGRWPDQAMQSSTSCVCSAMCRCSGSRGPELRQRAQLRFIDCAQAVRRDAEHCVGQPRGRRLAGREQPLVLARAADEAALPRRGRRAAEARVRVEHRQQGEPDAGIGGRRDDTRRHLADAGVLAPVGVVVQVVKLARLA